MTATFANFDRDLAVAGAVGQLFAMPDVVEEVEEVVDFEVPWQDLLLRLDDQR